MKNMHYGHASSDAVYGMGFVGALVYFLSHSATFWLVLVGIFKAIFWPAFLVYSSFQFFIK